MSIVCDNGILVSVKKYNERCSRVIIFSENNGIVQTFARTSRVLGPGQVYDFLSFRCRYVDSYNYRDLEMSTIRGYLRNVFNNSLSMAILNSAVAIVNLFLKERGSMENLYKLFKNLLFLTEFPSAKLLTHYLDLLLNILIFFGIRLNTNRCAVTGVDNSAYYISPKTGNCVSREVGEKYKNRLFMIPESFSRYSESKEDISNAVEIVHYFLRRIYSDSGMGGGIRAVEIFKGILLEEIQKM
ncbi:MAG: DNA repair protein RecO C-terminal domain-containing protein [Rickettsiales bacterium]|jgi:DNA repair protein RecO (recombination protein O)|nr:DNA repair protein RecO C-terminal domain-containing protein [Rickettsiales bacterium]